MPTTTAPTTRPPPPPPVGLYETPDASVPQPDYQVHNFLIIKLIPLICQRFKKKTRKLTLTIINMKVQCVTDVANHIYRESCTTFRTPHITIK